MVKQHSSIILHQRHYKCMAIHTMQLSKFVIFSRLADHAVLPRIARIFPCKHCDIICLLCLLKTFSSDIHCTYLHVLFYACMYNDNYSIIIILFQLCIIEICQLTQIKRSDKECTTTETAYCVVYKLNTGSCLRLT